MPKRKGLADRKREMMLAASARWNAHREERQATLAQLATVGPGSADSPQRRARFEARQELLSRAAGLREAGVLPVFVERKIGATLDYLSQAPSEAARRAGRPVGRIVSSVDPKIQADGYASSFLIHPGLLLTNWHVFPDRESAAGTGVNFLYEEGERGIELGLTFAIDPDLFFFSDEQLDSAIVGVSPVALTGTPLADIGFIAPTEATSKILKGQPIDIIQFPDGGPKRYATRNNRLLDILDEGFLHYETDTQEGSSGSPAFSEAWELVALHHAGVPQVKDGKIMTVDGEPWSEEMGDDNVRWLANEGVRISAIVRSLAAATFADPAQAELARLLLESTTDPADDISRILSQDAPRSSPPTLTAGPATFTFTGPVTINVGAMALPPSAVTLAEEITAPEKSIRFDPDYDARAGYDPAFLGEGRIIPLPTVSPERLEEMLRSDGEVVVLPYHNFSLAMNAKRRLQMWSAVNVDYDSTLRGDKSRAEFGSDRWIGDPRIPANLQISDPMIYGPAGQIDRGHIVRREDNAWGESSQAVEFANSDTFHWTNCTPQHAAFNRASPPKRKYGDQKGLWGSFETYVQRNLVADGTRACILSGPVLAADDPVANFGAYAVQCPMRFWKVVVVPEVRADGTPGLGAYGFVMSQKDVVDRFGIEFAPGRFERYRVPLAEISRESGVVFDETVQAVERP